jgi:hypothetical protein
LDIDLIFVDSELVERIFYVQTDGRMLFIQDEKFQNDSIKFEMFETQKSNEITLLRGHIHGTFQFFMIYIANISANLSRRNSKLSGYASISRGF